MSIKQLREKTRDKKKIKKKLDGLQVRTAEEKSLKIKTENNEQEEQ